MANKYEKRGDIVDSSQATIVLLRYLRRIDPAVLTTMRVLGHTYELQTKYDILQSKYGAQNLNRIDQCTAEEDGKELGDSRRKITLSYAAKASYTGSIKRRRMHCGYAGDCRSAHCVCYKTASDVLSTVIGALASVPKSDKFELHPDSGRRAGRGGRGR